MPSVIQQAQPPLEFIQPAYSPLTRFAARSLLRPFLSWKLHVTDVQSQNTETLAQLYHQFQTGKTRFLIAFRHPSTLDPFCIATLLWEQVPQSARQHHLPLRDAVHAHFVYDRGIPLWAGQLSAWGMSKLGGTPIRRGGIDRMGLRSIRNLFINGRFPLAAAPEGGTNGHNEIISPIEPGIAQFGFWGWEDLQAAGRSEEVLIVPLGVQYRFAEMPWHNLEQVLKQLEADSGLAVANVPAPYTAIVQDQPTDEQIASLYKRLYQLGLHLLLKMEQFYLKFYRQSLPPAVIEALTAAQAIDLQDIPATPSVINDQLAQRLQLLLGAALSVAEQFFQLQAKGTVIDRCRRVEQAGWERIYREDLQLAMLSPVEQGLADRLAEEADLRLWHMRLVENFVSVTGRYVIEKPTAERFADTLMLLWKMIRRIENRPAPPTPFLGQRQALLTVGEPLSVSDRAQDYKTNRRQAVVTLTQDLQAELERLIV